jgi:hypothetical protein
VSKVQDVEHTLIVWVSILCTLKEKLVIANRMKQQTD